MKHPFILCCIVASALSVPGAERWARPDLVAKAQRGEATVADVSWWGTDAQDAHRFIDAAIRSHAPTVRLDRAQASWPIGRTLWGRSDLTLVVPEGVELVAKRGSFHGSGENLIALKYFTNVVVTGGGTLRMHFEDYTNRALYAWSEWRHSVSVSSCRHVTLEDLRIVDSGGDCIYLGQARTGMPNEDVTIRRVLCRRGNRQGISVISAVGLRIEDTVMEDTCGTPPMSGIDFEPNAWYERLDGIVLRNCIARNNRGFGFDFSIFPIAHADITLEDCRSEGNARGTHFPPGHNTARGWRGGIRFVRSVFNDRNRDLGAFRPAHPTDRRSYALTFEDCRAADPQTGLVGPLPAGCGWAAAPWPTYADGVRLRGVRWTAAALADARVCDTCPDRTVALAPFNGRGKMDFLFHAPAPGPVAFKGVSTPVGKSPFRTPMIEARDVAGAWKAQLKGPTAFRQEHAFVCDVPAPGFYRLTVNSFAHVFRLTESRVPVAYVSGDDGRACGLDGGAATAYVALPADCPRFALAACGGGGNERVHVRLFDPSDRLVWDRDNVGDLECGAFLKPAPGLWRIEATPPTQGCSDDYALDIFDRPVVFFLSREKTWCTRSGRQNNDSTFGR